jgi:hypothetical protein
MGLFVFGLLLIVMGAFYAYLLRTGLRTGVVYARFTRAARLDRPILYWFVIVMFCSVAILECVVGSWLVYQGALGCTLTDNRSCDGTAKPRTAPGLEAQRRQ